MENIALTQAKQNLVPVISQTKSLGDLFSSQNLKNFGNFLTGSVDQGAFKFQAARENARKTGKLLAHFLALDRDRNPVFGDHTFSLLGFSLGSQVCKSTINRLKKLEKTNLVHNLYFMAGATYITKQKQQE